tara:strand:+ start:700 stop:939 length:240 start_codon:yes stop_codon:yes gene_type:complete
MTNLNDKFINYVNAHQKVTESTSNVINKMNEIINVHTKRIREQDKTIKFLLYIHVATLVVVGLVHATHSGWFDSIGWLQ